jgi:hypothetical protein
MERIWCWRCKSEMPMLDEDEFFSVQALYSGGIKATKEFRQKWGIALEGVPIDDLFRPVRTRYEELTGMKDCHQNAIMHHRISLYGPPCGQCGKPLRTPKAKLCGACMHPKSESLLDPGAR